VRIWQWELVFGFTIGTLPRACGNSIADWLPLVQIAGPLQPLYSGRTIALKLLALHFRKATRPPPNNPRHRDYLLRRVNSPIAVTGG
jgi:hypothetical protein